MTDEERRADALEQADAAGILRYVREMHLSDRYPEGWEGHISLDILPILRADLYNERTNPTGRWYEGCFWGLHAEIGPDLTDFRADIPFCQIHKRYMQLVISQTTGAFYLDTDADNPYRDMKSQLWHLASVVSGFAKSAWGWLSRKQKAKTC